jgi:hypothetical protein
MAKGNENMAMDGRWTRSYALPKKTLKPKKHKASLKPVKGFGNG